MQNKASNSDVRWLGCLQRATRNRFDGLAPAYGQAVWARFLASRAFKIMRLRIETSINNIFLRPHSCPGVEGIFSQEALRSRVETSSCLS